MKSFLINVFFQGYAKGLYLPFWIIYLSNKGYSLLQIGILGTVLEIVRLVTEVPLGVIADRYGRKFVMLFSSIFFMLASVLLASSKTFTLVLISTLLMGLAESLDSGAASAWLTDYLILKSNSDQLENKFTLYYIILIIGSILGALSLIILYRLNPALPFYVSAIFFTFSFIAIKFFMIETLDKKNEKSEKLTSISIIKSSFVHIRKKKALSIITFTFLFYAFGLDGVERFYQTFLYNEGFNVNSITGIFLISSFISIIIMVYQNKFLTKFKNKLLIVFISKLTMAIAVIIALSSISYVAYIMICLFFTLELSIRPLMQSYLNSNIESSIRATTLSFFELVGSIGEMFSGICIGFMMDYFGINIGFKICALVISISSVCLFNVYLNNNFYQKKNAKEITTS